jgi:protein-S-isoprenylcysteine O-methyltransferase Ste14
MITPADNVPFTPESGHEYVEALFSPIALLGAVLVALGLWLKARAEERFLLSEFAPETYESYRRRVPMLVPFLPHH